MTFADINVTQTGIHEFKINGKKMSNKCIVVTANYSLHIYSFRFDIRRDITLVMWVIKCAYFFFLFWLFGFLFRFVQSQSWLDLMCALIGLKWQRISTILMVRLFLFLTYVIDTTSFIIVRRTIPYKYNGLCFGHMRIAH